MTHHFKNYFWKEAIPQGHQLTESLAGITYRVVADPYHKRVSIEQYRDGHFYACLYDSVLLDFRHLKKPEQTAWQRIVLKENELEMICLIRNRDDRILFKEIYRFEQDLCRECRIYSPHDLFLSSHRMSYKALGEVFNGVTLYDAETRPVMQKSYEVDKESGEFTELLEEKWDFSV